MITKHRSYIIGAGGVGSWLVPAMAKLVTPSTITIVDGDTLEKKNLDRQLFDATAIGANKAFALAEKYPDVNFIPQYYTPRCMTHNANDVLLVAVDNHPARMAALEAVDNYLCTAIIGANETHSAEAYIYKPSMRETKLDPRVYYPEMLTSKEGDPTAPRGCTGVAQEQNRQLATANFMAASLMVHLYVLWIQHFTDAEDMPDVMAKLPYKLYSTMSRLGCHLIEETYEQD